MKGLLIIATVLLAFGGGLYLLFQPSDRDLERVEQDLALLLDQGSSSLARVTLGLNALRSIRPNLQGLDQELNGLRRQHDQLRREYHQALELRPSRSEDHAPFLRKRKQMRSLAGKLQEDAQGLMQRVATVEAYMRDTQPRVQVMKQAFLELFTLRRKLEQDGRQLEPELGLKIDYLYAEKESLLALARNVITTAIQDAGQGRTIAASVTAGVERMIADAQAMTRTLRAP